MKPLTPEELAQHLDVEIHVARALLASATGRGGGPVRRTRMGAWVALSLVMAGTVFAGIRSELVSFLSRVNPPEVGEVVPRQIPYRGYLERDGVPLTAPSQVFGFRIEYGDGGTAWSDPAVSLPVSDGNFEVALGDSPSNKIPSAVFADPYVQISVSVSGVGLVGRQRLLTVPFASRADTANTAINGVPPGTIVAFGGPVAPPGWLICDGRSVNRTDFPALWSAIGVAHGTPSATQFNLPDYRGRFLRGVDGDAGVDPDALNRVAMNPLGNSGNAVGSIEPSATALPATQFTTGFDGIHQHGIRNFSGGGLVSANQYAAAAQNYNNTAGFLTEPAGGHAHIVVGGGDSETRPVNAYVNWIIKW